MGVSIASAVFVAVVAALFRAEIEAWTPRITERIRQLALRPLKGAIKERLDEEWAAFLEEVPGNLSKLACAFGFVFAAHRMDIEAKLADIAYRLLGHLGETLMRGVIVVALVASAINGYPTRRLVSWRVTHFITISFLRLLIVTLKLYYWRLRLIKDDIERNALKKQLDDIFNPFVDKVTASLQPRSAIG